MQRINPKPPYCLACITFSNQTVTKMNNLYTVQSKQNTLTSQLASHSGSKFEFQKDKERNTEQHYPCHSVQAELQRHTHSIRGRTPINHQEQSRAEPPHRTP